MTIKTPGTDKTSTIGTQAQHNDPDQDWDVVVIGSGPGGASGLGPLS